MSELSLKSSDESSLYVSLAQAPTWIVKRQSKHNGNKNRYQ